MSEEELLIEKFGLCPEGSCHTEIKELMEKEIAEHDHSEGCGDYLLLLCFMLFYIGKVEDCQLIWRAKRLNMDTGCMIDVGLLCCAGYEKTIDFISSRPELNDIKVYLERFEQAGDEFDRDVIIANFRQYDNS